MERENLEEILADIRDLMAVQLAEKIWNTDPTDRSEAARIAARMLRRMLADYLPNDQRSRSSPRSQGLGSAPGSATSRRPT